MDPSLYTVFEYHDATKHHPHRYARSLGYLDWATQPDPFLKFEGADEELLPLPDLAAAPGPSWGRVLAGGLVAAPLDRPSLSRMLYTSMALSAWKEVRGPDGNLLQRWSLRVNPSSGNLHPTETWLLDAAGLHHYRPDRHALEHVGVGCGWPEARGVLVGLTSVGWREAWKYGERSWRYCQHDAGHALAAVALAARALGWEARLLDGVPDELVGRLLGCARRNGPEADHPDLLLQVGPAAATAAPPTADELEALRKRLEARGTPRPLSASHHRWPLLEEIRAGTPWSGRAWAPAPPPPAQAIPEGPAFGALVRGRRSAVRMDGVTGVDAAAFRDICRAVLPGVLPGAVPLPWPPQVALVLFVHRVRGLDPGLYLLNRDPGLADDLRAALRPEAAWEHPAGCPDDLPLVRLGRGDLRAHARDLSCLQDIAADGAFAVAMLARFAPALRDWGPGFYPRLFRETGAVGQLLYLAAEAAGARATGIGCFFDDEVHRLLGLEGHDWQSLYHFTVGGALDDERLVTAPAYGPRDGPEI